MKLLTKPEIRTYAGGVYCPICTHTVEAEVQMAGKLVRVKPGQKCPRCASALDAGYVMRFGRAA